jgi:membrane-associated protein
MRSRRAKASLDWAERALDRRGASFIIAARYVPVGRVAVNMTAGALHFPRRRFVGLTAVAAVMWAAYSAAIGIGAGAVLKGNPLLAIVVGVVGGVVLGLLVDWLMRTWHRRRHADDPAPVTDASRSSPPA